MENNKDIIEAANCRVNVALNEGNKNSDMPKIQFKGFDTSSLMASKEDIAQMKLGLRRESQPVVLDGEIVEDCTHKKETLKEIQKAEEIQQQLREQYEKDKSFFENKILRKARAAGQIEEDFIKILHPTYRRKFLDGLAQYGTLAAACKYMKMQYNLVIRGDILSRMLILLPAFKQEVDDAIGEYQATLQMEIHRRAVEGIDKGIYHNGMQIATEKVYSDSLLAKMVDTHLPEYKETKQKESHRGNMVNVQIIKDFHNYKE